MSLFSTTYNTVLYDIMLLLVRIAAACFLITHGLGKLMMLMGDEPVQFADPIGVGQMASLILAIFAELICPFFIILGFATRLAVIPPIVLMLIAIFNIHSADPFSKQELPGLYLLIFLLFLVLGGGKYSVDYLIAKRRKAVNYR